MNVLYTCDDNYAWLMGVSMISLFENNREMTDLHVFLLEENISEDSKTTLENIAKQYERKLSIIEVPQIEIPESLVRGRWPASAFIRLYSSQLLPAEIDKVLYLDCDTIINRSLEELDEWDVSSSIIWGVRDCIGKGYKRNIGLNPNGVYINAGVLLINLQKLRRVNISERLDKYVRKYEKRISYADQDILNGVFKGVIGILPAKYDLMTITAVYSYKDIIKLRKPTNYYHETELIEAVKEPAIIHYTTNMMTVRPWYKNTNHPYAFSFHRFFSISPWKDRQLKEMVFNNMESKIFRILEKAPSSISIVVLGFLHSVIKPFSVRLKDLLSKGVIK